MNEKPIADLKPTQHAADAPNVRENLPAQKVGAEKVRGGLLTPREGDVP